MPPGGAVATENVSGRMRRRSVMAQGTRGRFTITIEGETGGKAIDCLILLFGFCVFCWL